MHNTLVKIGGFTVYSYGFMIGLGIIMGFIVLYYRMKKYNLDYDKSIDMMLWGIIPGFIFAKLTYVLVELQTLKVYYYTSRDNFNLSIRNGFVIYGGIIAGIIFIFLYLKVKKLDIGTYMDVGIASVALAQGFGRIGCFLAGCCYGIGYSGPLNVKFPFTGYGPMDTPLLPTQLIFSLADFINFGILCLSKRYNKIKGGTMALYMITYGLGRFGLEFLRGDERGTILGVSTSQFISICMVPVGCLIYAYLAYRYNKGEKNEAKETIQGQNK